jgi:hypothetical protein
MADLPENARKTPSRALDRLSVVFVSTYLLAVGVWLIITRQIPSPGFLRIARAYLRPRYSAVVRGFTPERGHCYLAPLPAHLLSDRESSSAIQVFENSRPLGPAHASHEDIRWIGKGRFSHWGDQLHLSTSDNSDPRTNGRRYIVQEMRR